MLYPDVNLQKRTQQNTTRYRTALYLRLSREDGDKTESDSIANQRTLLEAYAIDHPELCIVDEFVDDGYSGSNFERPAFQNLFRELEQGTIYLCQIYRDSLKTYNNRAMRLLREECRHEFWASYEPASDNSGGKPENECWERCYPYSWKSGLYLRFAEERSEVYCNHAVCCGASHVL